jgi:hypothetical protein
MLIRVALGRFVSAAAVIVLFTHVPALSSRAETKQQPLGILLAAGDISTCGSEAWNKYANETGEVIQGVIKAAREMQPPVPVRVLALGDLAYGVGSEHEFECFGERWKGFESELLPVPGNHEYLSPDAWPYFNFFRTNLLVAQNGADAGYFMLRFPRADGPWLLIGLNDNFEQKPKYAQKMNGQMTWLEEVLAKDGSSCVLAFWHAPTFSSGKHGHDYKKSVKAPLTKHRPMQRAFESLFRHGASVVLAGHDHNYEQFRPQDAQSRAKPDRQGIRLFVIGTGGSILTEDRYQIRAANSEGIYGISKGGQGVLKMELYEDRYVWDFLPIDKAKALPLETRSAECTRRKQ